MIIKVKLDSSEECFGCPYLSTHQLGTYCRYKYNNKDKNGRVLRDKKCIEDNGK